MPDDSELARAVRVLARAQQDAVWDRQQIQNKLRSVLREYYPTFLATFDKLASRDARATLALAPTPATAATLRQPAPVEAALGQQAAAYLRALEAAVANIGDLEHAMVAAFDQHPDAAIITSFPGLMERLPRYEMLVRERC